jgi:hypothetical protein
MTRVVSYKRMDLTDEEWAYLQQLEKNFGKDFLRGLFSTDDDGIILSVTPPANRDVPTIAIFFLMNVSLNQRLRMLDTQIQKIPELESKILQLEERLKKV